MGTIVTKAGLADIATASFMHEQCNWTKMAVGDGGGSQYVPTDTQTELRGQKWIGNIDNYTSTSETQGIFQTHIPTDIGGFVIREIGIFNEDEELVAIGTVADQTKTALSSGDDHYSDMLIDFHIAVDHADSIKVQVNPNITVATTEYVLGQLENYVQKEQGKSLVEDGKITQIDTNKSSIESLQSDLTSYKTTVSDTYVKKVSGKDLVSTSDITQITTNKDAIASLQSTVSENGDAISSIQNSLKGIDLTQIATNKASIETLTTQLASIQEELTGVATILSDVTKRLGAVN